MGDGRFDQDKLIKTIADERTRHPAHRHGRARKAERLDHQRGDARRHRRSGRLPLTAEQLEAAIRADGKSVDSNLRGFRAGFDAARAKRARRKPARRRKRADHAPDCSSMRSATRCRPLAQPTAIEGVRRLDCLSRAPPTRSSISTGCAPWSMLTRPAARRASLLKEVARQLAVRMSYEDVVRVAQAKIAPSRMRRIAREELRAKRRAVHRCTISSSPASRNSASCCRRCWRGRSCARRSARAGSAASISAWRSIRPRSAAICASCCWPNCARWRPYGHRFKQEQAQIEIAGSP